MYKYDLRQKNGEEDSTSNISQNGGEQLIPRSRKYNKTQYGCNYITVFTVILSFTFFLSSGSINGQEAILVVTAFLPLSQTDGPTVFRPPIKTGAPKSNEQFLTGIVETYENNTRYCCITRID